jgi:hypothetical protein
MPSLRRLSSLKYLTTDSKQIVSNFSEVITSLPWNRLVPENFEANVLKGLRLSDEWQSIIKGYEVLPPGTCWDEQKGRIRERFFKPGYSVTFLSEFLDAAEEFFSQFEGRLIGVRLSGGLDSSLIIGMLRHFDIPHALIGMATDRYEFRTERSIQETLASSCEYVRLVDYEKHLPLSSLGLVPAHEYPDLSINNFSAEDAMAKACSELGVEVFLGGSGGDVVLGSSVSSESTLFEWPAQIFNCFWLKDVVYKPHGIELVEFYENAKIINALFHLRKGQPWDSQKKWARKFFRQFLPTELSEFTYKADFWGLYHDGLSKAKETILEIHEKALAITGHSYFAADCLLPLFEQDLLTSNKTLHQKIEARAALATWVASLQKFRESEVTSLASP